MAQCWQQLQPLPTVAAWGLALHGMNAACSTCRWITVQAVLQGSLCTFGERLLCPAIHLCGQHLLDELLENVGFKRMPQWQLGSSCCLVALQNIGFSFCALSSG